MRKLYSLSAGLLLVGMLSPVAHGKISYAKQIKPILAKMCYKCHGAKKQKGDLRLDTPAHILKGADGEKVLYAGKPDKSSLYKLTTLPKDHEDVMPSKGDTLTKAQQALLKQWIAEGANFGKAGPVVVPAASISALKALRAKGALAMTIARDTNLLNVDFRAEAGKITDADLELLKAVKVQIAQLNLGKTKITDAGLAALAGMENLTHLNLHSTAITDAGLAKLKGLNSLYYLNLYGTKVSDKGLASLKQFQTLKKLFVWQTKVTDAGAKQLPGVYVNTGWKAPAKPAPPKKPVKTVKVINKKCPLSGKAVNTSIYVVYKGQAIGLCCNNCKAKFAKAPAKYIGKVKEFKKSE